MSNYYEKNNQIENRKNPVQILKGMLDKQSSEINDKMASEYHLKGLLNNDASLNPDRYIDIYTSEKLEDDARIARDCEVKFSSADNPGVQSFYKTKFGVEGKDKIIAKWKEEKSKEKNSQMEMAVTLLLSEMLGDDFLVVRTAPYDDYVNGIDNIIIDRKSGEVIGAFDEVHDSNNGRYTEAKRQKVEKIARKGGTEIAYGLKIENGKLVRAKLTNVPVFYLGLEESKFIKLRDGLISNNIEAKNEIFNEFIDSLSEQHKSLKKLSYKNEFLTKLKSLDAFISNIKDKTNKK